MRIARNSIGYRILLPIFILVACLTGALLLLVQRITHEVREDYHRFTVAASAGQIATIMELAAAELTAARLTDNPIVVEAKKGAVRGAILNFWRRGGLGGVIAAGGVPLDSTLDQGTTRAALERGGTGYFTQPGSVADAQFFSQEFPIWGWTVTTAVLRPSAPTERRTLVLLLPVLTLGSLVLATGLFFVLWRNLRHPVTEMVGAVREGRAILPTGIDEFDAIGRAVGEALERVRERTEELGVELAERRRVEAALQEREEQVRLLLNSTAEGIYGVDTAGICTFCNPSCLRILGYDREDELLGRSIHALIHHTRTDGTPYPEAECRSFLAYRVGRETHVDDEVFWRKDAKSIRVEYWSHPIVDPDDVVAGAVVAFFDISEKSALEQQLRQAQKMEAVGRLAGGIAHDFNNMLMAIVGYASLGRELAPAGSKLQFYGDQVLVAADKAADLTRQILAFSRKQVMSTVPVDLNATIFGLGKIMTRLLGEDIEVCLNLSASGLVALADRAQIEQVLMNLATNARDAMPAGGRLVIGTQAVFCDRESVAAHGLELTGRYALISVSDSGCGMDAQTRERIFEPFFTTKELGKGTGLGLSIVYGIVKQHRGQVSVYSEPGRGTTVKIYLPLTQEDPADRAEPAPEPVRGGDETVLLAEDNEEVRTLARSVLEQAGYRVVEARDGKDAVRQFAAHAGEVQLCLFDVVMPQLSGMAALETIRELHPGTRALFMSGYAADVLTGPAAAGRGVVLLSKPFLPRELLLKVRETLDAPPSRPR